MSQSRQPNLRIITTPAYLSHPTSLPRSSNSLGSGYSSFPRVVTPSSRCSRKMDSGVPRTLAQLGGLVSLSRARARLDIQERERERKRERQTHAQTHRDRDRERQRESQRDKEGEERQRELLCVLAFSSHVGFHGATPQREGACSSSTSSYLSIDLILPLYLSLVSVL